MKCHDISISSLAYDMNPIILSETVEQKILLAVMTHRLDSLSLAANSTFCPVSLDARETSVAVKAKCFVYFILFNFCECTDKTVMIK